MTRKVCWLIALTGACLTAAIARAADVPAVNDDGRETQVLLDKLSKLSEQLVTGAQSPTAYRLQLDQGDVLMKLAVKTKEGRDGWLKMAVDAYANAASQAPDAEAHASRWLEQVSAYVAQTFPGTNLTSYIAYKQVQVDHLRAIARNNTEDPAKVQERLCERLVAFADAMPRAPEAPKALIEVAEAREMMRKVDAARATYRTLLARYPGSAAAKTARESLWRLGLEGEVIEMKLPQLYGRPGEPAFDLKDLRGRAAVVYFWSSTSPEVAEDVQVLREIGDRYRRHGLEVVFVNVDAAPEAGREYLSNRLTGGTHVYQAGGVNAGVTAHYGIKSLPETVLIGTDGALVSHATHAAGIDAAVIKLLGPSADGKRR